MFTFICIGVILIVAVRFFRKNIIGLVQENSMYPALKHNDLIIIKQEFELKEGRIYLVKVDGEDKYFVKRLEHINDYEELYFLGDNADESYDSRDFGYIRPSSVIGEVIKLFGGKQNG